MSRIRASPPNHLLVDPINQTSVEIHWRHDAKTDEESPTGYEVVIYEIRK